MEATAARPPRSFRIVAILALLWMVIGVALWFMNLMIDETALAAMTESQRQYVENYPSWLQWIYGLAVFSGLAGAIGLLLRKAWAVPALLLSAASVLIQFVGGLVGARAIELVGAGSAIGMPVVILGIGVAIWWYADRAKKRGWLVG